MHIKVLLTYTHRDIYNVEFTQSNFVRITFFLFFEQGVQPSQVHTPGNNTLFSATQTMLHIYEHSNSTKGTSFHVCNMIIIPSIIYCKTMIQQLVTLKFCMMRLLFPYPELLNCTEFELYIRIRNINMTDWSISDSYHI